MLTWTVNTNLEEGLVRVKARGDPSRAAAVPEEAVDLLHPGGAGRRRLVDLRGLDRAEGRRELRRHEAREVGHVPRRRERAVSLLLGSFRNAVVLSFRTAVFGGIKTGFSD